MLAVRHRDCNGVAPACCQQMEVSGSRTNNLSGLSRGRAGKARTSAPQFSIGPNALQGGTIEDVAGNAVTRVFNGLPANRRHLVETIPPVVRAVEDVMFVSHAGSNGTYTTGDEIRIHVEFNVLVYRRGEPPVLKLSIGSLERDAVFQEGSGTQTLKFQYIVEPGDTDDDGISVGPNALIGSVEDGGGNAVDLTLPATEAQGEHKVSAELMLYPQRRGRLPRDSRRVIPIWGAVGGKGRLETELNVIHPYLPA